MLFLAQLYGVDLSLFEQAGVVGVAILGVIVGIDRLDMCRTTLNVTGDLVIAATVAFD